MTRAAIHPDTQGRLERLTRALVEIPSATGQEKAACDYLEKKFRGSGLALRRLGNNLLLHTPLLRGRRTLGLLGHLDTVTPHPSDRVHVTGRGRHRTLYGIGSSDMKSGVALIQALLEDAAKTPPRFNLVAVFYDREEGPFVQNGLGAVLKKFHALLRRIDLALVLEPSHNVVQAGCLGTLHATLRFAGQRAHSARPWQGDNAIYKTLPLLNRLEKHRGQARRIQGLAFREALSITQAHSGPTTRNTIPDECALNLNYRFFPDRGTAQARREVLKLVRGACAVEFIDVAPGGMPGLRNPLLREFIAAYRLKLEPKQAWTDVARLTAAGIAAVNFGPGEQKWAHQKGERLKVADSVRCFQILRDFIFVK